MSTETENRPPSVSLTGGYFPGGMPVSMKANEKYGRLTYTGKRERGLKNPKGEFVCECGTRKWIGLGHVSGGKTRSCGCLKGSPMKPGEKRGRLTYLGKRERCVKNPKGEFICECGTRKWIGLGCVSSGHSKSCGCLNDEKHRARALDQTKLVEGVHSTAHPLYLTWRGMHSRCYNKRVERYPFYGGRGIRVCDRWRGDDGFANFVKDMGERPPGCSIDRIDNDRNYTPENCRWATNREQQRNKRNNVTLTLDGDTMTVAEWARVLGVCAGTLRGRIKRGWTDERAILTPIKP